MSDKKIVVKLGIDKESFDQDIDEASDKTKDFYEKISNAKKQMSESANADGMQQFVQSMGYVAGTLDMMQRSFSNLPTMLQAAGASVKGALGSPIASIIEQMSVFEKAIQKIEKQGASSLTNKEVNSLVGAATTIRTNAARIQSIRKLGETVGTTQYMNGTSKQRVGVDVLAEKTRDTLYGRYNQRTNFDTAVRSVARNEKFRAGVNKIYGKQMDDAAYEDIARISMNRTYAANRYTDARNIGAKAAYIRKPRPLFRGEDMPEMFRRSYNATGTIDEKQYPIADAGTLRSFMSKGIYNQIKRAASADKSGTIARLAQEAGMFTLEKQNASDDAGYRRWRGHLTQGQLQHFSGSLSKTLYELRSGDLRFQKDPNETDKTNKVIGQILGLQEMISNKTQGRNFTPRIHDTSNLDIYGPKNKFVTQTGRANEHNRVTRVGNLETTLIPKTEFDLKTGQLVYRTNQDYKLGKASNAKNRFESSTSASQSRSLLTDLLQVEKQKETGLGVVNSEDGGRKIPAIIKVGTSNLLRKKIDSNGKETMDSQVDPNHQAMFDRLTGGVVEYGPDKDKYVYAFNNGGEAYLIPQYKKQQIEKQYSDRGLPSPFNFYNYHGLYGEDGALYDRKTITKQINNARKMNSPSAPLEEVMGTSAYKNFTVANWTALNRLAGVTKQEQDATGNLIDSLALIDPKYSSMDFQGRLGELKFATQRQNFKSVLTKSGILGVPGLSSNMVRYNEKGVPIQAWVPGLAIDHNNAEIYSQLQDFAYGRGKFNPNVAENLPNIEAFRERYMTNILDENIGMLLLDTSTKSAQMGRTMPLSEYIKRENLTPEQVEALKQDSTRYNAATGDVNLSQKEIMKRMQDVATLEGGPRVMKSDEEFNTRSRFLSQSAAEALNLPPSFYAMSARNYEQWYKDMQDPNFLRQHYFADNPTAMRKIEQDPNWVESDEAQSQIQSAIEDQKKKQENQQLMLDESVMLSLATTLPGSYFGALSKVLGTSDQAGLTKNNFFQALFPQGLRKHYQDRVDSLQKQLQIQDNLPTEGVDNGVLERRAKMRQHQLELIQDSRNKISAIDSGNYFIDFGLQTDSAISARNPNAYGTAVAGINLARTLGSEDKWVAQQYERAGLTRDTHILPPQALFKMNTGDYDGDTVWSLVASRDIAYNEAFDNVLNIDETLAPYKERILKQLKGSQAVKPAAAESEARARQDAMVFHGNAQNKMGIGAAILRNALQMEDGDAKWAMILSGIDFYDKATSEAMNQGIDMKASDQQQSLLMGGRNFNRLVKQINEYDDAEEIDKAQLANAEENSIFKTNLASMNDINTMGAIYGLQRVKDRGVNFDARANSYISAMYGEDAPLLDAAKWYMGVYSNELYGRKFHNQQDVDAGLKHVQALGDYSKRLKANGQLERAQRVDTETYRLQKRIQEMQSERSASAENMQALIDENDPQKQAQARMFESMLANQDFDTIMPTLDMLEQGRADMIALELGIEQNRRKNAIANRIDEVDAQITATKRPKANVTSVEPWMYNTKQSPQLMVKTWKQREGNTWQTSGTLTPMMPTFGDEKVQAEHLYTELFGEQKDTADILLGNIMHKTFEDTFMESLKGNKQFNAKQFSTKRFEDLLTGSALLSDNGSEPQNVYEAFKALGLEVVKDGQGYRFNNIGYKPDSIMSSSFSRMNEKLANMWSADGSGSIAGFLDMLFNKEWGPQGPFENLGTMFVKGIEGKIFDSTGKLLEEGNSDSVRVKAGQQEYMTHAKPDVMLGFKGGDGNDRYYVIDYKSSRSGATNSLVQSSVYMDMYQRMARAAWGGDSQVEADNTKEAYKDLIVPKRYQKDDGNGHKAGDIMYDDNGRMMYSTRIGGVVGFDARNRELQVMKYDEKTGQMYYDEYINALGQKQKAFANGSPEAYDLKRRILEAEGFDKKDIDGILKSQQVRAQVASNQNAMSAPVAAMMSAKYMASHEELGQLAKEIGKQDWKQSNRGDVITGIDKFAGWKKRLDEGISTQELRGLLQQNGVDDKTINDLISDDENTLANARMQLTSAQLKAAANDPQNVIAMLNRANRQTKEYSPLYAYNGMAKQVANTKAQIEGLKELGGFDESTKEWKNSAIQEQYKRGTDTFSQMDEELNKYANKLLADSKTMNDDKMEQLSSQGVYQSKTQKYKMARQAYSKQWDQFIAQREQNIASAQEKLNKANTGQLNLDSNQQMILQGTVKQETEALERARELRQTHENNLNMQDQLTKLQNENSFNNVRDRNAAALRQIGYGQEQFKLQRRRMVDSSMFGRYYEMYDQRRLQNQQREESLNDLISAKERDVSALKIRADLQNDPNGEAAKNLKNAEEQLSGYKSQLAAVKEEQEGMDKSSMLMSAGFDVIASSVGRLVTRLGRQMFMKAVQEAKKFVVEFDASMNEIQAITMKSDEDTSELGDSFIDLAKKMKVSVKDVTSVAGALYRQGLSDDEVNTRLQDVVKFSKVAGIKTTEATEIITTAMQNGLVNNSTEAMDSLVALGDSAATTADKIGKAMRKCAASANLAGVSYGELNSMLTIMTSMTQLSGQQVGTAVNTILTRMHNVTTSGYTKDVNGETTGINEVEKALKLAGISLREQDGTTWRSATNVLLDISKNWNDVSDIQRSNISTALAGTRGANMFTTLMEGMAEDNGETFAKYLGLSENSEGITDKKYEAMIDSITASMDKFKSTYDGLIESMTNNGVISTAINMGSGILDALTEMNKLGPLAATGLTAVGAAIGFLAVKMVALNALSGPMGWILGLLSMAGGIAAVGGLAGGIAGVINNSSQQQKQEAQHAYTVATNYTNNQQQEISYYEKKIKRMEQLGEKYNKLGENMDPAQMSEFTTGLTDLSGILPQLGSNIDGVSGSLANWANIVNQAKSAVENMKDISAETAQALGNIAASKGWKEKYENQYEQGVKGPYGFSDDDLDAQRNRIITASSILLSAQKDNWSDNGMLALFNGEAGTSLTDAQSAYLDWYMENDADIQAGISSHMEQWEKSYRPTSFKTVDEYYQALSDAGFGEYKDGNKRPIQSALQQQLDRMDGQLVSQNPILNDILNQLTQAGYELFTENTKIGKNTLVRKGKNGKPQRLTPAFLEARYKELNGSMIYQQWYQQQYQQQYQDQVQKWKGLIRDDIEEGLINGQVPFVGQVETNTGLSGFNAFANVDTFKSFLLAAGGKGSFKVGDDISGSYANEKELNKDLESMLSYAWDSMAIKERGKYNYASTSDFVKDAMSGFTELTRTTNIARANNPEAPDLVDDLIGQLYRTFTDGSYERYIADNAYAEDTAKAKVLLDYYDTYMNGPKLKYSTSENERIKELATAGVVEELKRRGEGHITDEQIKDSELISTLYQSQIQQYESDKTGYTKKYGSQDLLKSLYQYKDVLYESRQEAEDAALRSVLGEGSHTQEQVMKNIDRIAAEYGLITNGMGETEDIDKQIASAALGKTKSDLTNKTNAIKLLDIFNNAKTNIGEHGNSITAFKERANAAGLLMPWLYADDNALAVMNALTQEGGSKYFSYEDIGTLLNGMISGENYFSDTWKKDTLNKAFSTEENPVDFMQMLAGGTFGEGMDLQHVQEMLTDPAMALFFDSMTGGYADLKDMMIDYTNGVEITKERQHELYVEMQAEGVVANNKYAASSEKVASNLKALGKQSSEATKALGSMLSETRSMNNAMVAANKVRGKSGKQLDSKDKEMLSAATGIDKYDIEEMTAEQINTIADMAESGANEQYAELGATLMERLQSSLNEALANNEITIDEAVKIGVNADGYVDASTALALAQRLGDQTAAALASAAGPIGTLYAQLLASGDSVSAKLVFSKLSKGGSGSYKGGGGGGGGGGKSEAQKLIEQLKRQLAVRTHRIKMIQYNESKYENAGQLTNYDKALRAQIIAQQDLMKQLDVNIDKLKAQLSNTQKGTDDWYSLTEAILSAEEQYAEASNTIADINIKLHQNRIAILKTRIELENMIADEIQTRIDEQRQMVEGQSQAEQTIMDLIRKRYQDEWALIQQGIERKKAALEKEKEFLRESLDARKEAEDEAEKMEELAELRRQLAMVEMDSTRTKDAKELRKKIADIEKDITWDAMQDEVEARQKALDDQSEAMDEYAQYYEEDLQELLSNANNFADEINNILGMSQEDLINWLKDNDEEYQHALQATQETIVNSWTDTYKQMKGIVDTFWEEVIGIMTDEDSFIEYMKGSSMYKNASDTQKEIYELEWRDLYKTYLSANKDTTTVPQEDHLEDFETYGLQNAPKTNNNNNTNKTSGLWQSVVDGVKDAVAGKIIQNAIAGKGTTISDLATGDKIAYSKGAEQKTTNTSNGGFLGMGTPISVKVDNEIKLTDLKQHATGGLVDYTGLTWVDGTPGKPEAFLSAEDTVNIKSLMDVLTHVKYTPFMSSINPSMFSGSTSNSIGEINVSITEAEFKEDADYNEVARRVGEEFAKELSRNGFNTANYNF